MFLILILVGVGWIYVALMMAVAEASSSTGSVVGAVMTFLFYGLGPAALLLYILSTPLRRQLRRLREAGQAPQPADSSEPDAGSQPAADAVAPMRKEP